MDEPVTVTFTGDYRARGCTAHRGDTRTVAAAVAGQLVAMGAAVEGDTLPPRPLATLGAEPAGPAPWPLCWAQPDCDCERCAP